MPVSADCLAEPCKAPPGMLSALAGVTGTAVVKPVAVTAVPGDTTTTMAKVEAQSGVTKRSMIGGETVHEIGTAAGDHAHAQGRHLAIGSDPETARATGTTARSVLGHLSDAGGNGATRLTETTRGNVAPPRKENGDATESATEIVSESVRVIAMTGETDRAIEEIGGIESVRLSDVLTPLMTSTYQVDTAAPDLPLRPRHLRHRTRRQPPRPCLSPAWTSTSSRTTILVWTSVLFPRRALLRT